MKIIFFAVFLCAFAWCAEGFAGGAQPTLKAYTTSGGENKSLVKPVRKDQFLPLIDTNDTYADNHDKSLGAHQRGYYRLVKQRKEEYFNIVRKHNLLSE